jgi:hypothetical protein
MARNKLINIHSVALNTAGDGPKLPTKDQIEYGEIAVNYLKDNETISIRNSNDEIKSLSLNAPFINDSNGKGGIEPYYLKGSATGANSVAMGGRESAVTYIVSNGTCYLDGDEYDYLVGYKCGRVENGNLSKIYTVKTVSYDDSTDHTTLTFTEDITSADAKIILGDSDNEYKAYFFTSPIASGDYSHAEGGAKQASGKYSHAEGQNTTASGLSSHAEGQNTTASGLSSHAEGQNTTASGLSSHAEGWYATASGKTSHAEGWYATASGDYSHAEGWYATASGKTSHAEGWYATASGDYSHAEGLSTTASGGNSHAEGCNTTASGNNSHAEGLSTTASGSYSHAECCGNSEGSMCHSEGMSCVAGDKEATDTAQGWCHAEGGYTFAYGTGSHCEGYGSTSLYIKGKVTSVANKTFELYIDDTSDYFKCKDDNFSLLWQYLSSNTNVVNKLFRIGERYFYDTWDNAMLDKDEDKRTRDKFRISGVSTIPSYDSATKTVTITINGLESNWASFFNTFTDNTEFYVEWLLNTVAFGQSSHVEGGHNICVGFNSHVGGNRNICIDNNSFVGGNGCASQNGDSFMYGTCLRASTTSYGHSTIVGAYNSPVDYGLFVVGNGNSNDNRKNAVVVTSTGTFQTENAWTTSSDIRLKNVLDDTISIETDKISEMPVFTYTRKNIENSQTMIGSSAQYWQGVLPEAVKEDENGYLSLDYNGVLLTCVKSLSKTVEHYKTEIEALKSEIEKLKK